MRVLQHWHAASGWLCQRQELGLDHFEGRSWQGLHRHALMTMIAYAFLQYRRLKTARREKKEPTGRRRDRHCPPCARPSSNSSLDHRRSDARAAENGFAAKSSVNKSAKVVLGLVDKSCEPSGQSGWAYGIALHMGNFIAATDRKKTAQVRPGAQRWLAEHVPFSQHSFRNRRRHPTERPFSVPCKPGRR